ncbi:hypothetical protein EYF80_031592 [Liparis tanakae]|uniref:Uncharacterized protein n=1 Tax=Liparis tanakae TaxID=230148 RepID=A0A4Z2GXH3_9TELE|nr:hypothetical protein EYF80_031592 [Liparis tanakae]
MADLLSEEGRDLGGSILMAGSHSPGGSTMTSSRNSSMPASRKLVSVYLVGTGTSVSAPSITACCRRTNATKGASRKSTSPTSTLEASASLGNFFMNLFLS